MESSNDSRLRSILCPEQGANLREVDKCMWFNLFSGCDPYTVMLTAMRIPRDTCYVASEGLPQLVYSGYQPHAYSWDEFPPLKDILDAVHKALPGSRFNSLLLNRYKGGDDYVGWHADDEKLYGPTPEIASLSFGCEREFLLKKKPDKTSRGKNTSGEPPRKRLKKDAFPDKHSFVLKHGSLLVMRGYTQRDWLHSVPKRVKADSLRINLTFRLVL
ncbi:DNA oxidative demethylase ALKBH2 isoform X3 [Solanum pennellii]|uniref:DNA oxidative demethylase ALKBH2 isoform X3 n=1 Tax=Solanum pennellii TaxID=28526 RepID=A0ABM1GKD4_SOLPN|nr:DNA oxidative demethylase ALKBH2 isoform X3 [Solanum pennellii]